MKGQRSSAASARPMVVLPAPAVPITMMTTGPLSDASLHPIMTAPGIAPTPMDHASDGQPPAAHDVAERVYHELRRVAAAYMRRERPGQTLQPTALVHEVYLRL